jgi:malonyl-CoA/methylmalonyl-CoA synthetase
MLTWPRSILHAFVEHAERAPDAACLTFEGQRWGRGRLHEQARRWAGALAAWGLEPGQRVALFLENSPSFVAAYLGVHLAGGIVVLVNTQYRQVELRHILADAGVVLCVTGRAGRTELARVVSELIALEGVVTVGRGADEPDEEALLANNVRELDEESFLADGRAGAGRLPESESVAVIGYTSGTTGRSKGAALRHRNLAANAASVTQAWRWTSEDRLLLTLPLFHAHGLFVGTHGTLLTGASADLRRKFEAGDVFETLMSGEVTMFFGVPTMYTRLIAEAERRGARPPPIRLYVSGSAPLAVETFTQFERLFGQRILERYGMTETIMNLTNPYEGERRPGTVGGPFPGQEARIVDVATRRPIEGEEPGEIQVRGPHVFAGYWENPEATAEAFDAVPDPRAGTPARSGPPEARSGAWFNTGDLGWRSADGYYTISGRARELIISGGFNVYPREVEEVLLTHPGVADVAVLGLPHPDFGEQVVAAVEVGGEAPSAEALVELCRDQLASYKKPRQVFFVESLPRNALGKVQKHILREQLLARAPR